MRKDKSEKTVSMVASTMLTPSLKEGPPQEGRWSQSATHGRHNAKAKCRTKLSDIHGNHCRRSSRAAMLMLRH